MKSGILAMGGIALTLSLAGCAGGPAAEPVVETQSPCARIADAPAQEATQFSLLGNVWVDDDVALNGVRVMVDGEGSSAETCTNAAGRWAIFVPTKGTYVVTLDKATLPDDVKVTDEELSQVVEFGLTDVKAVNFFFGSAEEEVTSTASASAIDLISASPSVRSDTFDFTEDGGFTAVGHIEWFQAVPVSAEQATACTGLGITTGLSHTPDEYSWTAVGAEVSFYDTTAGGFAYPHTTSVEFEHLDGSMSVGFTCGTERQPRTTVFEAVDLSTDPDIYWRVYPELKTPENPDGVLQVNLGQLWISGSGGGGIGNCTNTKDGDTAPACISPYPG